MVKITITKIFVPKDLNLGGWVVHPLPWPNEIDSLLIFIPVLIKLGPV
jgi:hypothetical protein